MIGRSTSGQALLETLVVVPACVLAAGVLVEVGAIGAEQLSVRDAAASAAVAELAGGDAHAAATGSLAPSLDGDVTVERKGSRMVVSVRSSNRLLRMTGQRTLLASAVVATREVTA